eukprot:880931-Amphidinium_carterae.1
MQYESLQTGCQQSSVRVGYAVFPWHCCQPISGGCNVRRTTQLQDCQEVQAGIIVCLVGLPVPSNSSQVRRHSMNFPDISIVALSTPSLSSAVYKGLVGCDSHTSNDVAASVVGKRVATKGLGCPCLPGSKPLHTSRFQPVNKWQYGSGASPYCNASPPQCNVCLHQINEHGALDSSVSTIETKYRID